MTEETKAKVLKVFEEAYPQDLSITGSSLKAGISDATGAMYIRILEAEGKVKFTRMVGKSKMFRLVNRCSQEVHPLKWVDELRSGRKPK